jgi:hypothetical protein
LNTLLPVCVQTPNIKTLQSRQPAPGSTRIRTRAVLVPPRKSPLGLVARVHRDLFANILHARGVHAVQEAEFSAFIPPVLGQPGEVRDLVLVDGVEVPPGGGGRGEGGKAEGRAGENGRADTHAHVRD